VMLVYPHKTLDIVGFALVAVVIFLQWFQRPAIRTS